MTSPLIRRTLALAYCGALLATGCGGQTIAPEPAAEAPMDGLDSEPAPEAPGEREQSETDELPAEEESEDAEEGDAGNSPFKEESGEPTGEKKQPFETSHDIDKDMAVFDEVMGAEELSCDGARPIRDAICAIAHRICKMSTEQGTRPSAQCSRAKKSCEEARTRFSQKCG